MEPLPERVDVRIKAEKPVFSEVDGDVARLSEVIRIVLLDLQHARDHDARNNKQ
jgi:hypothetical protein